MKTKKKEVKPFEYEVEDFTPGFFVAVIFSVIVMIAFVVLFAIIIAAGIIQIGAAI